jgi:hypothetical protein
MARTAMGACGLVLLAACGGGGSDDLTCDLLQDPTNCWATAAAAAAACVPGATESGVLADDRASCTFSDGSRVVFDEPLPTDIFDLERLAFTLVDVDGADCARFVDTFANRMELEAGGAAIVSELHPGEQFHLHCPDTTYEAAFDLLFTCPAFSAPTDGFDVDATMVTFSISSVATQTPIFTCYIEAPTKPS